MLCLPAASSALQPFGLLTLFLHRLLFFSSVKIIIQFCIFITGICNNIDVNDDDELLVTDPTAPLMDHT